MKNKIVISFFLIFFISNYSIAQNKNTISGYIKSAETGESLIGATMYVTELKSGTATNSYGFYSITLLEGKYSVRYSYMGYKSKTITIDLKENITKTIELETADTQIKEVVISAEAADKNIKDAEMSVIKLSPREIKVIPVMFGEQDILKTIQLMPGVKSAGEGNSGFYVRGGSSDQNLIILDEAPVYNASHLLGFFSVFNSDAVKDMKLYKGNAPAQYGGRLSSVLDVQMNEGNSKKLSVSGGLGLISSKLTIEAPIIKNKGSFIISARRTYADMFLVFMKDTTFRKTKLYFYDVNAKANFRIGKKDRIFLSGYLGRDVFGFSDMMGFDWGNKTATLRWNHLFGNKLFLNTTLIYSDYNYVIGFQPTGDLVEISSGILDYNLKEDFQYFINSKNTLNFGVNSIHHTFRPGEISSDNKDFISSLIIDEKYAIESAGYISHKLNISDKLKFTYGLRYSNFSIIGIDTVYTYDENDIITDTTAFGKNELVENYNNFEPRATISFIVNEKNSIKASYARNSQYIHLLSNSTSSSPTDLWLPSSKIIKPQIADQVAIGYFKNFKENMFETSVEIYYKNFLNQIDYQNGADIMLNDKVESQLVFGEGRAYGIELFIKKRTGKFTGWLGYTFAKTERSIEAIDNGAWYPAKQDRTHDISIVAMYNFNKKWNVSATWVYYTGNAVTFPSGKYEIEGLTVPAYTSRNGYRMPDYHRMDLGVTYINKKRKRWESSWNLSIYNVYARKNAYSIDFQVSETDPNQTEAVRLALFQIIPSITYNFKF